MLMLVLFPAAKYSLDVDMAFISFWLILRFENLPHHLECDP